MISKLCYELYKVDWKRNHMITVDREMDSIKDYYEFIEESDCNENLYTYDDYIEEFGYDGELYVCYDEFLETEYLEEDYICRLLDNRKLISMYYQDLDCCNCKLLEPGREDGTCIHYINNDCHYGYHNVKEEM